VERSFAMQIGEQLPIDGRSWLGLKDQLARRPRNGEFAAK
jgi:hypothetical protein